MNRINRKLCSQDSLAFAELEIKTIAVRISNTNTVRFQITSNK
jgi:hypothetical protein